MSSLPTVEIRSHRITNHSVKHSCQKCLAEKSFAKSLRGNELISVSHAYRERERATFALGFRPQMNVEIYIIALFLFFLKNSVKSTYVPIFKLFSRNIIQT